MKYLLLTLAFLFSLCSVSNTAYSQTHKSARLHPKWMNKMPLASNNTFNYKKETAIANSLDEARGKCLAQLLSQTGHKNMTVLSKDRSNVNVTKYWDNGKLTEHVDYNSLTESTSQSDIVTLQIEEIDEYWEEDSFGRFHLTKLYASSAPNKEAFFDDVTLTNHYGARGLLRSVVLPGWGQLYKGDKLKAGLIIGGCAAVAACITFTECERANFDKKIGQTSVTEHKRDYINKRNNYETARNICIGTAAVLYLYNIIDAIAAPGATRVVTKDRKPHYHCYVAPTVMGNGATGLSASILF